ncbi:MAG: hypothetical protein ACM3U2_07835 [Deltaproteobacteria bacterium]
MATSTLDHRLTGVRRRVRQVLLTHGLSWLAAVLVGSVLLVCLADWLVHLDDPVIRLIFGLAILGAVAWVVRRHLIGPLQVRISDTDLALRIEDRYPGFHDSLASSVQFIQSGTDPKIGSPALQQVVVEKTLARLDGLDCDDVVDMREARRIAGIALGVCLTAALLAGLNRTLTTIALKRILSPFSAPAWPKKTNLQLLTADLARVDFDADHPLMIARGDTFRILAENTSGRLPARVTLEYRLADRKLLAETMRPKTVNDDRGGRHEVAEGQLVAVRGDLEFRAVGGDDDQMPWHRLLVVPPPAVEKLQVTLTPPAYTRRPAETQPQGVGHVQGLIGTRVEISALANKPVEKAALRVKDQERRKVELTEDGRRLKTAFVIAEAGIHSWWLELKDAQGFEDAEPPRYEVRGIQDFEPEIYIEQPASDMQVTAEAVVPVRTIARDDLGVREVRLVYKVEPAEGAEEQTVSLFRAGDELPLTRAAEHRWKIADLHPRPGSRIVFHTEATDDFDLSADFPGGKAPAPHVGRSVTRTLTIVSSAEKSQEIGQRQEGLLDDLERVFKLEQQAHDQVDDLLVQLRSAEKFRPEDVDSLQRTEMGQREVAAQLTGPATGLEKRARDLVGDLRDNHIDDPQTERRLQRIADELARIGEQHLRPIEQDLTRARKLAQSRGKRDKPLTEKPNEPKPENKKQPADRPEEALREVADNQNAVLESLGEMLQDLSQWRGEHEASGEVADLVRQQAELNQRTAELAKTTLTRPADSLSPQEQADLAKIAERQKKQADQLEQLEAKMQGTMEKLASENPTAAATLQEAVEQSRHEGIAGEMRDAAGQIGENRMGLAARTQQDVFQKLRDLEDTLRQKRESDTEMMVKKLKQTGAELQELHDRQAELLRKTQEAERISNPQEREKELETLRKEQEKLHEETDRMSRRLARLEARGPQASTRRAASRMQQAQDRLDEQNQGGAADQQQEAIDDLEQAQRELARQQRAAEEQLAREQLARVADELTGMIPRQQSAIDETRRLDELHARSAKWSRAQLVSLRDLAKVQHNLEEETGRIIEKLSAAEVFALALKGAARQMHSAGEQLARRETGPPTQKTQEAARKRLADLVEALKPDEPNPDENPPGQPGGGGTGQPDGPPSDGVPAIAQVKMLITLQKELFARTAEIERLRGKDGQLPLPARQELETIAREQGDLADLARNLSNIGSSGDEAMDEKPGEKEPPRSE